MHFYDFLASNALCVSNRSTNLIVMNFFLLLTVFLLTSCRALNPNAYKDQSAAMDACNEKGHEMGLKTVTCNYDSSKGRYVELLVPNSSGLGSKPNQRFWFL